MKLFNIFDSSQFSVLLITISLLKILRTCISQEIDKLFSFKSIDMLRVFMTLRNRITNKHKQQTKAAAVRTCRPATLPTQMFSANF